MKKRATINMLTMMIYQVTSMLVGLLLPKYYTETFGSVYNGLNQSISQIMSLLAVLQYGISAASIQAMFKPIADGDTEKISAIYYLTGKQYRKMGYWFIALMIPITVLFPFVIENEVSYSIVVAFLILKSTSSAMEYFFQAKYSVLLIADNKSYAVYIVNTVLAVVGTALHLTVLFTFKNIILYQFVAVVVSFLRMFIIMTYIRRKYPYIKENKHTDVKVEVKQRKDVMVSEVASLVVDSTDLLVLSSFSSLINASIYSIYGFVTTGLSNVLSSAREAVFASFGKIFFSDGERFKEKMDLFETLYFALAFFLYSVAIILFKPFIVFYTSGMDANYVYEGLPFLFILAKLVVNLRIPAIICVNTAGHFKQVKYYAVIEAAANIIISLLLVKPLGIYGVLIGTIIAALIRTPLLVRYSYKNILKEKVSSYLKKLLCWGTPFVICCVVAEITDFTSETLLGWLELAVPTTLAVGVVFAIWTFVFDRKTFMWAKDTALRAFKRVKIKKEA